MKDIYTALVKCQSQIRTAIKDSRNPHFKSTYADLGSVWDAVKDALHSNGLAVIQLSRIHESGAPVLVTRIIHTSGEHIEGEYPLVCKDPTDPQKLVAATTYARRASLSAALGVIADDDDGNTAAGHSAPAKQVVANVAKSASPAAELLAMHGKTMADIETAVGGAQQGWTSSQKEKAKAILQDLKAGKQWAEAIK